MLPTPTDNGARLAAILPTALTSQASGLGKDALLTLNATLQPLGETSPNESALASSGVLERAVPVRSVIVVVVDGLGHANLRAAAGHARTLSALATRRIETVIPSTTAAALTTITTGRLPGEHGLIGYKIRHPELGLITPLKEWQGIERPREWQRAEPLFAQAAALGARPVAIGRPAHAVGGLTEAILRGAEYHPGQTIAERFAVASRLVRGSDPLFAYLYVDELDRVAHQQGWQSPLWVKRLEQLDEALTDLLRALPADVGVVVTADHGMIDVPPEHRLVLDEAIAQFDEGMEIGGEPRMRSLYLSDRTRAAEVADDISGVLGKRAWVGTRDEAIAANWFGPIEHEVAERLGDVIVAARAQFAFQLSTDEDSARAMVGQHGGVSDEERGVPLALGGAFEGSSFAAAVSQVATLVGR
ncbi:MAG: alkaline phosphatase family protein [Leucobacter sp.]|nr:alkaline phosphatase family protein [Leucobacter sp.]